MARPSLPVRLLAGLFIAAGVIGIVYHAPDLRTGSRGEAMLELFVRLLAVVGGVFTWRGANWSRWLLIAWLLFHIVLSLGDTSALLAHLVLLLIVAYVFFFSAAAGLFRPDDGK